MAVSQNACVTLQSLPQDIHFCLLQFLDWQSLVALRKTCSAFAILTTKEQLRHQHALRTAQMYDEEQALVSRMEAEFWELAEQVFLGLHPNYFQSSTGDPDLEAISKRWSCSSDILPCYICLRWLPSTTSVTRFATESQFSRSRSVLQFDLGGKRSRDRFCIPCGFRKGTYLRGTVVKRSVVCLHCGQLGDPIPNRTYIWAPGSSWWRGYFCEACFRTDGVVKLTHEQYVHERRYGKHDAGLKRGKEYRMDKGRMLRKERGIENEKDQKEQLSAAIHRGPNASYCPIMRERRFCSCNG